MSSAGQQLVAGRIPGERIATTIETADSATTTTTEIETISVTAPLVNGRTYRVRLAANCQTSVAGDRANIRIREDNVSGSQLSIHAQDMDSTTGVGYKHVLEVEFDAVATGDKTFVGTIERAGGTGSVNLDASTTNPAYLYVDYIRE